MANKPPANIPVNKIRSGVLTVTIWQNDGDNGTWFSVTATRSYKQVEEWKESDNFGLDDLLRLAKLLVQADPWIVTALQPDRQSGQEAVSVSAAVVFQLVRLMVSSHD